MKYAYGEFDGEEFPTPDSLFDYDQIMDFILEYGDRAMEALEKMNPADAEILEKMIQEGMLEKAAGKFRLTPRAVNQMQRKALMEIFAHLPRGSRESHPTANPGAGAERMEGTKKYVFGDPISELDLNASMRNAMARTAEARKAADKERGRDGEQASAKEKLEKDALANMAIQISERDLELHHVEGSTTVAICILLDMSGSMMRYGRFMSAKKVAMALTALSPPSWPT